MLSSGLASCDGRKKERKKEYGVSLLSSCLHDDVDCIDDDVKRDSNVQTHPFVSYSINYIRGAFNTFLYRHLKLVVDSWKITKLFLYILWDDWPIFMILGSNEQLQQELEYTLLKPDCHCWWISKMQPGREDTLEEWYSIKRCSKLGKNAARETYEMLQTAFRPSCINRALVFEWHKRFKEGRESVRDDERCGRSKEVNTPELIG